MSGLCLSLGLGQSTAPSSEMSVLPAQEPTLQLLELADGTVEIVAGEGLLTLTIAGGTDYDGTYEIDPLALEAGPVNLVTPALSGLAEPGETLTLRPGLWVYHAPLGVPVLSHQWLADGLPIPGATGTSHAVATGEAGKVIGLRETAVQGDVTRHAEAEGLAVPGARVPVFLLIGQSNMLGKAAYDGLTVWPAGSREWTSAGLVDIGGTAVPLGAAEAGTMGMALEFSDRWIGARGGEAIFIQAALGGTGFVDNRWNPGDDLYQAAVSRTNACLADDPDRYLAGIFFIQGGKDSTTAAGADAYHDALYAMVTGLRGDIIGAAQVPLVLSGTTTTSNPGYKWAGQVDSAQELLFQRVERVAYVNTDGLAFFDGLHWDAPSLRAVGQRFFDRLSAGVTSTAHAGGGTPTVTSVGHGFVAVTGTTTTIATSASVAAGEDVYVILASRGNGEITGVTIGGQSATEVYGQVDYNNASPVGAGDGLFIFKVTAETAMTAPAVVVEHGLTGLRIGCATFVISGAAVDRVKAENDFARNNTAVILSKTFTTSKPALVITAGMFSSGTSGWDGETLANVVVSTGIDPGNLTNNWTVSWDAFGAGASVLTSARANCGNAAQNYGSLFAALLIE